ncbi:hypothetical protein D6851_03810 [Altericroceibacterium spongiae]|uniref:Uncharacterized protein n=1 Tax=Altericroceibacterium spongiae TaxID=2320269 RepID=A0A420ENT2_9SPHN|nr:hypothetical protein D6851_03810 [Altericroceibacterium spongiae]
MTALRATSSDRCWSKRQGSTAAPMSASRSAGRRATGPRRLRSRNISIASAIGFLNLARSSGGHAASTACASIATPRRLRTALKMAARLSMLGLPFSDSIR